MSEKREMLHEWVSLLLTKTEATDDGRALVADALDAYAALDVALDDALPQDFKLLRAYRDVPGPGGRIC